MLPAVLHITRFITAVPPPQQKNAPADFFLDRGVFLCYNTNATLKKGSYPCPEQ